jgi:MFS family permease
MNANFSFMVRALRYRNYRLFFTGQIVSLMGSWITSTASAWLVYRLTGSAFLLGVVGFSGQIPSFLLAPLAGVYVDRWNRHRLLMVTQFLSMLQSCALAYLTLSGLVTIEWIIALNVFQGVVNAFDMPCRQSFVVSMIEDKNDLGNAIALNSSMFNVARLLGPMAAGAIIAASNEGWCFFIDAVSYLAVLFALLAMRIPAGESQRGSTTGVLAQFKEGWLYVSNFRPIRSVILLLALTSLVGVPYAVLIPVFAVKVLHGGPHTLGFLMTASGCGAGLGVGDGAMAFGDGIISSDRTAACGSTAASARPRINAITSLSALAVTVSD